MTKQTPRPDFSLESQYVGPVAGVDEVGRGPLAGPVFACACVLDPNRVAPDLLGGLRDSKTLSDKRRRDLAARLTADPGVGFCLGEASVAEIDAINILQATFLAMTRALDGLSVTPVAVLVDGNRPLKGLACDCQAVVKGDGRCLSIAAASILAKVARDDLMGRLAQDHPGYGWEKNAGYGTRTHLEALNRLGPTPHHRRSFAPVRQMCVHEA